MLRVSYKKVYGYFYIKSSENKTFKCTIHPANCLFAVVFHYKDEKGDKMVQLISFYTDLEHLKRCYKKNNTIDEIAKVTLFSNCPEVFKVAKILVKANIPVTLKYKKN